MKLHCPQNSDHKLFLREAYGSDGTRANVELVDEFGRFVGDELDLYSGDFSYVFICADCGKIARETNG